MTEHWWAEQLVPWMGPMVDTELINRCESYLGIRLPASFLQVYRVQNGGVPAWDFRVPGLFALTNETHAHSHSIRSLGAWVGDLLNEEDLGWISEDLGDAELLFPVWREASTAYALNFNRNGRDGEPSIVWLDFECGSCSVVAESFSAWTEPKRLSSDEARITGSCENGGRSGLPDKLKKDPGTLPGDFNTSELGSNDFTVPPILNLPPDSRAGLKVPQEMQSLVVAQIAAGDNIVGCLTSIRSEEMALKIEVELGEAVAEYESAYDMLVSYVSEQLSDDDFMIYGHANAQLARYRIEISCELTRIAQKLPKAQGIIRKYGQRLKRTDIA